MNNKDYSNKEKKIIAKQIKLFYPGFNHYFSTFGENGRPVIVLHKIVDFYDLVNSERIHTVKFQHIYHTTGFSVSAQVSGDGKEHLAPSKHACMSHGYWCSSQLKQQGYLAFLDWLKYWIIYPYNAIRALVYKYFNI